LRGSPKRLNASGVSGNKGFGNTVTDSIIKEAHKVNYSSLKRWASCFIEATCPTSPS